MHLVDTDSTSFQFVQSLEGLEIPHLILLVVLDSSICTVVGAFELPKAECCWFWHWP